MLPWGNPLAGIVLVLADMAYIFLSVTLPGRLLKWLIVGKARTNRYTAIGTCLSAALVITALAGNSKQSPANTNAQLCKQSGID